MRAVHEGPTYQARAPSDGLGVATFIAAAAGVTLAIATLLLLREADGGRTVLSVDDVTTEAAPAQITAVAPSVIVIGGTDARRAEIISAAARFDELAMTLPDLVVHTHDDRSGCDGALGVFNLNGSRHRIDLCVQHEIVMLHEFAHAWVDVTITMDERDRFLEFRGLTAWHDPDVPRRLTGAEVAANSIAFGLLSEPLSLDAARRALPKLENFVQLTGSEPPRLSITVAELAMMPMPIIDPHVVDMYTERSQGGG